MSTKPTNIAEAIHHHADPEWLSTNTDRIFDEITASLKRPEEVDGAIEGLLLLYPHVLPYGNVKHWSKLLVDAHKVLGATDTQDAYSLSSIVMNTMHDESIDQAFKHAMKRARRRLSARNMLKAYVGLLKAQIYRKPVDFNRDIIVSALELARIVNDQEAYAHMYLSLAYIHAAWSEFGKALTYADLAYRYWQQQKAPYETALSVYALATVNNRLEQPELALNWLEKAANLFAATDYHDQYALVASETGVASSLLGRYDEAVQWFELALNEAEKLDYPPAMAVYRHSLGIALTYAARYNDAEGYLHAARDYWASAGDDQQLAHIDYSLARMEALRGKKKPALGYLDSAAEHCQQLPDTMDFRAAQMDRINELRHTIETGGDVSAL